MKNLESLPKTTGSVFHSLSTLMELSDYTFVGGSALSIYLNHRKSEDIDLFTWKEKIDKEILIERLKSLYADNFLIENISDKQLDLNISGVKVTFFANKWDELKNSESLLNHIKIASLELLTAMKLNTLFMRAKFRDYYDLFVINKEIYSVSEMYEIIRKYMPQINKKLFQMALVFTDDIEEDNIKHLDPRYDVSISDIQKHFQKAVMKYLKN